MGTIGFRRSFPFWVWNVFLPRFIVVIVFCVFCPGKMEGVKWSTPALLGTIQMLLPRECLLIMNADEPLKIEAKAYEMNLKLLRRQAQPVRLYEYGDFFFHHTLVAHCLWEGTRWRPWQLWPKGLRKVRVRDPFVFVLPGRLRRGCKDRSFFFFRKSDVFLYVPCRKTKRKQQRKYNNGLLRYCCWRVLQVPLEYSWFVPKPEPYKLFLKKVIVCYPDTRFRSVYTSYQVYVYARTTCLFCG